MHSKLKIGTRLTFGFGLVISVFLVALSVILSYQSQTLASARQIKNENLPFVLIAERMMLDVSQVGQFLTDVAVSHHTEGFDEADKNAQDFHDNAEKFKTMFRNENDTVTLKKMAALQSQFSDFHALGRSDQHPSLPPSRPFTTTSKLVTGTSTIGPTTSKLVNAM